jgi:GNAT superfamily N-acetyltransferase
MNAADLESLERATVEAVAPPEVLEIDGWLAPLDNGTIGRAKSAVPLRHDIGPDAIAEIEAAYRQRGLKPIFRIADLPGLAAVCAELASRGFTPQKPTIFKIGLVADLAAISDGSADILKTPNDTWSEVFIGEGFEPIDAAHRIAALIRSPDAVYAAASEDGRIGGVGVITFGRGWAGIHGMRTALDQRGRGLASRVLGALGRVAQSRGVDRVSLQVEEANPARSIYRRAGLTPVWRYHYWR